VGPGWGDQGYGYIKATSNKIMCKVWYLEYKPRQIFFDKVQCCFKVDNVPSSADQLSWRMANTSLYSDNFPVIQNSFLPTLVNNSIQAWDTVFCQVKYLQGCTPAYTEPEIAKRVWIGKPNIPAIWGPSNVGINFTCQQTVNDPDYETTTSYFWTTTGPLTIVGSNTNSSCTIKGGPSCGSASVTVRVDNCYDTTYKTKPIWVDCRSPLAYPNPTNTELT
jgi:hypothetical protein